MKMKFPCLIDKRVCTTPVTLNIKQETVDKYGESPNYSMDDDNKFSLLDSDGQPVLGTFDTDTLYCNYQDSAKVVYTKDKKKVQLSGVAFFPGDIWPIGPVISGGSITIFGENREIYQGTKARNPDGSVNYTKIEVI